LTTLLARPSFTSVYAYSRKPLPISPDKLHPIEGDSATWAASFPASSKPQVLFSGLGTTKAQAGSVEKQRLIDYDLNYALAKAAKEAGVETYVIVSSSGANSKSMIPYSKMKGELEDDTIKLGFKHVVILRPGLIVGDRDDSRPAEFALRKIAGYMGAIGLKDAWAQDADMIAMAAVKAAELCIEGKRDEGTWILAQSDIVKLGKE
jgi:uncharacterized protein YbjT (DUF2867 family)